MKSNNSEALVSTVIPTYDRREYLQGAIQTAIGQTYENIEVIVVDDGSSRPYAADIVAEFPESVRCIRHEHNKGLSAARNTGIRSANGEYIAFLDDDDRWHKTKIARQVSALDEDNEVGLATCFVAALTPENEFVHCDSDAPSGDCSDSILVGNQIGTPSRVLVRQECFGDIGMFDESLPTKQDWDFYIRLCQEWDITAVRIYLCFRTIHESMSSSPKAALRDNNAIMKKHAELIRDKGLLDQAKGEIEERVGRSYLRTGELNNARNHLRESLRFQPTSGRVSLYLLTFTHPLLVERMRNAKRWVSISRKYCDDPTLLDGVIFGNNSRSGYGDD